MADVAVDTTCSRLTVEAGGMGRRGVRGLRKGAAAGWRCFVEAGEEKRL